MIDVWLVSCPAGRWHKRQQNRIYGHLHAEHRYIPTPTNHSFFRRKALGDNDNQVFCVSPLRSAARSFVNDRLGTVAVIATRLSHKHQPLGEVAQIDLVGERLPAEPVLLSFEIIANERLGRQLAALRRIYFHTEAGWQANRLRRQHLSLLAADARTAGADLRDVAELVLGPGSWPGDGEHRKSLVRRLVAAGTLLCQKGPAAILQSWPDGNG